MTTNTSATGGYLKPSTTAPAYDAALEDILHDLVVGITGLAGDRVMPRFQVDPPDQPEPTVDWCAIGVQSIRPNDGPALVHNPAGDGSTESQRHEDIEVLASFYGPRGQGNAGLLRDGLGISQNIEAIAASGLRFVAVEDITPAPALYNQTWIRKFDLPMRFRRNVSRTYPVLNLLSAVGTTKADDGASQNFDTENN